MSGLLGGERLDCVKASDQCLKEQSCSTKYRTLRQCVAGKESNFSRATGLEAKDECKSAMEALKQKSLYNCRCKRGMKKEKNCLRIYWSMYQSLQGTLQKTVLSPSLRTVPFIKRGFSSGGCLPSQVASSFALCSSTAKEGPFKCRLARAAVAAVSALVGKCRIKDFLQGDSVDLCKLKSKD